MYRPLVHAVRLLLGAEFLVNGLSWWVKLINEYPSVGDLARSGARHTLVDALIQTGYLFHVVKAVEVVAGLGLLCNLFVPFFLVFAFPITVSAFLFDAVEIHQLRAWVMGCGLALMNVFLLLAYLPYYRSTLVMRAEPESFGAVSRTSSGTHAAARTLLYASGGCAFALGLVMVLWHATMIYRHFAR